MARLIGATLDPGTPGVILEWDEPPGDATFIVHGRIRGTAGRGNNYIGLNCTGPFTKYLLDNQIGIAPFTSRFSNTTGMQFAEYVFDNNFDINDLDVEFVGDGDYSAVGGDEAGDWAGAGAQTVDGMRWNRTAGVTPQPDVTQVEQGFAQLTVNFDKGAIPYGLDGVVNFRWRAALAGLGGITVRKSLTVDAAFANDKSLTTAQTIWSDATSADIRSLVATYSSATVVSLSITRAPGYSIASGKRLWIDTHDEPIRMPTDGNGPWTFDRTDLQQQEHFDAIAGIDAGQGLPIAVADTGTIAGRDNASEIERYQVNATDTIPYNGTFVNSTFKLAVGDGTFWANTSTHVYHFNADGTFIASVLTTGLHPMDFNVRDVVPMENGRVLLRIFQQTQMRGYESDGSRWAAGDVNLAISTTTYEVRYVWRDPETGYFYVHVFWIGSGNQQFIFACDSAGARDTAADLRDADGDLVDTNLAGPFSGDANRFFYPTSAGIRSFSRVDGSGDREDVAAAAGYNVESAGITKLDGVVWVEDDNGTDRLVRYIIGESTPAAWQEVCCVETDHYTLIGLTVDEQVLIELEGASPLGLADRTFAVGAARAQLAPSRPDAPLLSNANGMVRLEWVNPDG